MSLKMKTVKGVVTLTWASPTMEASWRIRPNMPEEEMLDTLTRVVRFVRMQNRETADQILEIEQVIQSNGVSATPSGTAEESSTASRAQAATGTNPNAVRIPMMPPASLSDRPSDGGPTTDTFGWGSMPTTSVPAQLAAYEAGGWEMIQPGED